MKSLLLIALITPFTAALADLDLKQVAAEKQEGAAEFKKRNFGPYVGVYAGESFGQKANVTIQGRSFPLQDVSGSALFGIEIGKSWRMKKWPVMFSTRFEGTFSQTSLAGGIGNFNGGAVTNDVTSYQADMNSLMFTLGGSVSLDLWRYRGRFGEMTGSPRWARCSRVSNRMSARVLAAARCGSAMRPRARTRSRITAARLRLRRIPSTSMNSSTPGIGMPVSNGPGRTA